jgi:hypothetical protein
MFFDSLKKLLWTKSRAFSLSDRATQVLSRAEAEGSQVIRTVRQGAHVIVLQNQKGVTVHLWSNDDVEEYGRNKKWI